VTFSLGLVLETSWSEDTPDNDALVVAWTVTDSVLWHACGTTAGLAPALRLVVGSIDIEHAERALLLIGPSLSGGQRSIIGGFCTRWSR
jgi:hypothetical protein